jgi:hypothetical protein
MSSPPESYGDENEKKMKMKIKEENDACMDT